MASADAGGRTSERERLIALEKDVAMLKQELQPEGRCSMREELAKVKTTLKIFVWVGGALAVAVITQIVAFLSKGVP